MSWSTFLIAATVGNRHIQFGVSSFGKVCFVTDRNKMVQIKGISGDFSLAQMAYSSITLVDFKPVNHLGDRRPMDQGSSLMASIRHLSNSFRFLRSGSIESVQRIFLLSSILSTIGYELRTMFLAVLAIIFRDTNFMFGTALFGDGSKLFWIQRPCFTPLSVQLFSVLSPSKPLLCRLFVSMFSPILPTLGFMLFWMSFPSTLILLSQPLSMYGSVLFGLCLATSAHLAWSTFMGANEKKRKLSDRLLCVAGNAGLHGNLPVGWYGQCWALPDRAERLEYGGERPHNPAQPYYTIG